jgi:high affinity Mn2+ porin
MTCLARGGFDHALMIFHGSGGVKCDRDRSETRRRCPSLSVLAAIGTLCAPIVCGAQMVGPTPQPQGIPVTPEQAEEVQPESWAIHGQSTGVWLLQPAFRSPYQGPQSLSPAANGRETVDVTIYAGIRPWRGAEVWINPEIDQGFGLSNTFGVAGYPSGEAYKLGKAEPYFLVQRGFLRQTIDLSGEMEKLEPDLNQLGGTQTANRVVFTIGKYSVVDIFDTNTYAHDPRRDFLNWSIIDQGAFDYAATSWGYTYGGAAEWYQDWWTVRAGIFDLPQMPNSTKLSAGFSQGQFVTELEERHSLWDQPGKLKLLYWLTRGNLGTYLDAVSVGAATGQTPSTGAVRSFRTKDGFGLNFEQQLASDFGVFARASISQGTVEEVAFTDVNQSISGGLSLAGPRWGRPDDTAGLAGAVNRISHQGKIYLAAGGLGGIIGDGRLPNAGPERNPGGLLQRRRRQVRPLHGRLPIYQPPGLQPGPRSRVDFRSATAPSVLIGHRRDQIGAALLRGPERQAIWT